MTDHETNAERFRNQAEACRNEIDGYSNEDVGIYVDLHHAALEAERDSRLCSALRMSPAIDRALAEIERRRLSWQLLKLLGVLLRDGIRCRVHGDKLLVGPRSRLTPAMMELIEANKLTIMDVVKCDQYEGNGKL